MVLDQTITEESKPHLLSEALETESGRVFPIGFRESLVDALVEALRMEDSPPKVHLLTTESILKWMRGDFVLASEATDLIESGVLSIRASEDVSEQRLVVTGESVVSLVTAGEYIAGLPTSHGEFVDEANEKWSDRWNQANEFSLRTPSRSRVEDSLGETFDSEVEADFQTVVDGVETTRGEGQLDIVDICLLVAARHELLLYDISKWAEDVGVASKATFSRNKTNLEKRGLIKTEKVPIDVGRPRLRLLLGEDELQNAEITELADVVQRLLSQVPA